jgi:hypothetical protein
MGQFWKKSWAPGAILGAGLLVICGGCGGCYLAVGDKTYSEGTRDGFVYKFSHKGFFHKSWEGELSTTGFRSTGGEQPETSNIFFFSVEDHATDPVLRDEHGDPRRIVDILADPKLMDGRTFVRLHYRQIWFNAPGWSYSTDYRITRVEILPPEPAGGDKR